MQYDLHVSLIPIMFRTVLLSATLLAVAAVTAWDEEDVKARAKAAREACPAPGAVPHPWDPHLLVVCGGRRRLVAVVRCPDGTAASAAAGTCRPDPALNEVINEDGGHDGVKGSGQQVEDGGNGANEGSVSPIENEKPVHPLARRQVAAAADQGCEGVAGSRCADCDRLLVCGAGADGQVRQLANVSCAAAGEGLICDKTKRACAQGPTCDVSGEPDFQCLQPGAFPDPEDCKRYHICNEQLQHFSDTCDIAYDADKAVCVTEGNPCETKSPGLCSQGTLPAAIPGRTSFYRICLPRSPKGYRSTVLRCPYTQKFDENTGSCAYQCDDKRTRFPDPQNCRGYYECPGETTNPKVPKKGSCSAGLGFDAERRMCIQEANVTACSPVGSTNAVTPVVSIPTSAPTPTPATQPPPPAVPGQCTKEGVIPDPSGCRRYIVCSRSRVTGNFERDVRYCPFLTSYNANAKACLMGFCY